MAEYKYRLGEIEICSNVPGKRMMFRPGLVFKPDFRVKFIRRKKGEECDGLFVGTGDRPHRIIHAQPFGNYTMKIGKYERDQTFSVNSTIEKGRKMIVKTNNNNNLVFITIK